jgi:hypothetical protein
VVRELRYRPLAQKDLAEEKRRVPELLEALGAIGPPPDGVEERDPFEFRDRPGLELRCLIISSFPRRRESMHRSREARRLPGFRLSGSHRSSTLMGSLRE